MSAYPTDILLAKDGGRESVAETADHATVLLAKRILGRIAAGEAGSREIFSPVQEPMNWQKKFHTEHSNTQVLGYLAASEEVCRRYFPEREAAKLAESDGAGEGKDEDNTFEEPKLMVVEATTSYGRERSKSAVSK